MPPSLQDAMTQYQNGGAQAQLDAAVGKLLPGISSISSAPTGANFQAPANSSYSNGSNISKFFGFMGNVFKQTGNIAEGAAKWLGTQAVNMVEAPIKLGQSLGNELVAGGVAGHAPWQTELSSITAQNQQYTAQMQTLQQNFKNGTIDKASYLMGIKDISQSFDSLVQQQNALNNKINLNKQQATTSLINTAADLVTVLTAGFGKAVATDININGAKLTLDPVAAKTASEWLASKVAAPILDPAANTISKLATDSRLFTLLDKGTQSILQKATAEVVANVGGDMTAMQIAKATAANVALKYPMFFNYTSTTANQIYQQLDQAKYGDAVRSLAFNAALLLSGGPIGYALKQGSKALAGITEKTFGQTSFWDNLSQYYGTGQADGFANAIRNYADGMTSSERSSFIKDLASVEKTNISAMNGDVQAAAYRVAKGMQGQYAFNLTDVTHEQAIQDMVKFAHNFRVGSQAAEAAGLGPIAIGRLDARDKGAIASAITQGTDKTSKLQAWEQWKTANPNAAAANNANFDKQIHQLIDMHPGNAELHNSILSIKAGVTIKGFPQSVIDTMVKDGYIPIKPHNLEAPFKEGGAQLATKFNGSDSFFVKASQPLPVLGSVGALFTHMGLAPNSSTSLAYSLFNDNLAKNLANSKAFLGIKGESAVQETDTMIKQLSNFARDKKVPVKDLRMLTTKDITKALGVTNDVAHSVQTAIVDAHIQVPLAVRGMGDSIVDLSYKLPGSSPIVRRFTKLQGVARFSYNPFFQYLRVIPKTEILSTAEGGGAIRALFTGRAGQISGIREALHSGGFLQETGHLGNVMSGEAEGAFGFVGRNINKKLLPGQEISIAGLIDSQAQKMGMGWEQYLQTNRQAALDTIQMIAEYDRNSTFLNSPLARTLNIAFFPFRFDTKVAMIIGKNLAKSDLVTQVAVINGIMKGQTFLNSPEGQAWYSQNATAIGLMNYITPFASMAEVFKSLLPGNDHSLGNFGALGGLPFGWLPSMLDSVGLTHFNQPAMDAKTGTMFPTYVPVTDKGQLAVAIEDLLGQLFSYPGAMIGLPSKTSITRNVALGLTTASKAKDMKLVTPSPSEEQLAYSMTIGAQTAQNAPSPTPAPTVTNTPQQPLAPVQPVYKPGSGKKMKKSQYTPQLMPGQTTLGTIPGA